MLWAHYVYLANCMKAGCILYEHKVQNVWQNLKMDIKVALRTRSK